MSDADKAYAAALEVIERVKASGGTLLSLNKKQFHDLQRIPPEITDLMKLKHLNLDQTQLSDLSPLTGMTALQRLWLTQTQVSDLSPLTGMTALQVLYLNQTQVRDLSPLTGMTALQVLNLTQTQLSDLSPLTGMTALQRLWLTQTQVSDLSPLTGMTALQVLYLNQTQVSDLSPLTGMTALQELDLTQTQVSDLSPLTGMTALQGLWLTQTQVSDLSPLTGMTAMQVLNLNQTQVSDLRPIQELSGLGKGRVGGLRYVATPATDASSDLARLSVIKDDEQRTSETLAFLQTLPPYPEPLPWETSKAADSVTTATEPAQVAQSQITFLLEHAAISKTSAATTADQIRFALKDVPASDGNRLAPVLQSMLDVAMILDRLSSAPINQEDARSKQELETRIAELEAQVEDLTAKLGDAEQAKEAAEILAKASGVAGSFKTGFGKTMGVGMAALVAASIPTGLVYFLGVEHPVIQAYLTVLGRLPK